MPEIQQPTASQYRLRAKLPQVFRIVAIVLGACAVLAAIFGFYRGRSKPNFVLKPEHTQLSTNVIAEVNNYERLETDSGVSKYYIKADYAKTFSDNHQELENVYIEAYDKDGGSHDKMNADTVLYVPEQDKNFTAYLKGNVRIETRDALKVKTNNLTYSKKNETADADEMVEFERENIRGRSFGATVNMGQKRLELLKDVEIETFESPEMIKSNIRYAKINANSASYDQISDKIDLNQNVAINIIAKAKNGGAAQTTDVKADRATFGLTSGDKSPQLKEFELFENVHIVSTEPGRGLTNIDSGYAMYDKAAERYELKNGAHIVTDANGNPTDIRSSEAIFEQGNHKLALTGNAEIAQEENFLKGDSIFANLFIDNKIKDAIIRGNASARQTTPERTTTVSAPELNAAFNNSHRLQDANAIGQSTVEIIPSQNKDYTNVKVAAARGIGAVFKAEGLIASLRTDGRTTIQLNAPNGAADAANKRLTADAVTTLFNANGKDIKKTEAVGNAELYVEPLNASKENYRTTINAPRFDCEFFPTGNNAKTCTAGRKTKTVRAPTVAAEGRGTQTLTADMLTAEFSPGSNGIDTLDADGNSKFTELDRNAIAKQIIFTQIDQLVRLRGGEPTVWDSRARAKAGEIDWDTKNNRSSLRNSVSTTYYSGRQMKDSSPFGASDKPVFVTSDSAEFDHKTETATYNKNARGWQENNYVRGDRIFVDQNAGKFLADGNVQSLLYNVKTTQKGKESSVPTSAAAGSMAYDRDKRLLQYRTSVDIRQGTDRITAGSADVFLNDKSEVSKTIAETNVVITQPSRRATGDWAQYTADDETAILRGNPATVNDPENGSSSSGQITFSMRDNRVVTEGKTKQGASSRNRSVYRVKPN